jgi:EAL domain-containing protein (putative c-di-GMP-specific phosphodiesterase class I)
LGVVPKKLSWTMNDEMPDDAHGVRALTTADLGVVFQPIVDMVTGRTFAHEALARPKKPEYPNPMVLFQAAEQEEGCGRLGRLIRQVAFSTCGDVALFVNVHPQELSSHWLVQPDDPIGFHNRPVYLEVTETAAFTHFELCLRVLKDLCRRTGAALVVDDFGAGYSNLERVADLAPAIVKLDLALTRDIPRHKPRQIVVKHMVNMCNELGAKVVAEGVETLDELKCVRDLGVNYAQGYLLARPAAPPPGHDWPFEVPSARPPRRTPLAQVALPPLAPPPPPPPPARPLPPPARSVPGPTRRPPTPKSGSKPPVRNSRTPSGRSSASRSTKPPPRG